MFVATLLFYCICASFITLIFMQLFYWHIRCPLYKGAPNKRLDGQTAVVTGGNTGIGFETSKDLFRRGARVIMLCQDQVQGDDSVKQLMQEFRSVKNVGQAAAKHIDLASLESVRVCAKELIAEENRIDLLILNAGVLLSMRERKTQDGFEMHMGINYLAHYLLARLLVPILKSTAETGGKGDVRIVMTASVAHNYSQGPIRLDDLNFTKMPVMTSTAYAQSKLALILFAKELGKSLQGTGVTTYTMNPGPVHTAMANESSKTLFPDFPFKEFFFKLTMLWMFRTPVEGAQTILYCCLEESIKHRTGGYYCTLAEKKPSQYALMESDQKKLWDLSKELTKCKNAQV